jgi:16S rRNA (guanine966-N2)-methyltransferase
VGFLRIIAGDQRGRRIAVPRGVSVRPTADRVREALFSILGTAVQDARVLDAYAGSGALGFEALSRGAAGATFLEADHRALRTIEASAEQLGLAGRCEFRHGRVVDLLRRGSIAGSYDLVLADPPYEAGEGGAFLVLVVGVLVEGGTVVLERDARHEASAAPGLDLARTARYGRCCLDFYRHARSAGGRRGAAAGAGRPRGGDG